MTLFRDGLKVGGAAYVAKQFFNHRDKKHEAESRASQEVKQPQNQQSQQQSDQQAPMNSGSGQEYYRQPTSEQQNHGN